NPASFNSLRCLWNALIRLLSLSLSRDPEPVSLSASGCEISGFAVSPGAPVSAACTATAQSRRPAASVVRRIRDRRPIASTDRISSVLVVVGPSRGHGNTHPILSVRYSTHCRRGIDDGQLRVAKNVTRTGQSGTRSWAVLFG